eukprot:SAG31_NODE_27716_length_421_cov_0.940994_2_plen_45_part_01
MNQLPKKFNPFALQKVTNYANQLQGKMNAYQKLTAELTGLSSKSR